MHVHEWLYTQNDMKIYNKYYESEIEDEFFFAYGPSRQSAVQG